MLLPPPEMVVLVHKVRCPYLEYQLTPRVSNKSKLVSYLCHVRVICEEKKNMKFSIHLFSFYIYVFCFIFFIIITILMIIMFFFFIILKSICSNLKN